MATILFNDLVTLRQRSGVGQYASQILAHLPEAAPDLPLVPLSATLAGKPLAWLQARATSRRAPAAAAGAARRFGPDLVERYLGLAARLQRFRLFHEPDAIAAPTGRPTVTTFHDLSVIRFPQWHPAHRVRKYEQYLRRGLDRSQAFIAVSEATRREMISLLGLPAERIHVVPEAPRPFFRPLPAEAAARARARYDLPERYFLHVGNLEPRKNLELLIDGFLRLGPRFHGRHKLVLVGGWGWGSERLRDRLKDPVIHLGYLPDEDVVALTNGALALVCGSRYEGFGLPPLEAMACGVPVISTRCGALAETAGEVAIPISPDGVDTVSDAFRLVADNPGMRAEWGRRGLAQAARFTWRAAAEGTARVYRSLLV